jgi:hypothetical protein
VGLGLSGIKSLDVLRDLPPLHASNSTSTTGSTAAVIIIQPITLSNVLTRLHSSRKFTGVDPQAYLTKVLTKLVNPWPALENIAEIKSTSEQLGQWRAQSGSGIPS